MQVELGEAGGGSDALVAQISGQGASAFFLGSFLPGCIPEGGNIQRAALPLSRAPSAPSLAASEEKCLLGSAYLGVADITKGAQAGS